jgi:hypothetical protein
MPAILFFWDVALCSLADRTDVVKESTWSGNKVPGLDFIARPRTYQITGHNNPEVNNPNIHGRENPKAHYIQISGFNTILYELHSR